jgi:hypothetical protein
LCQHRSTRGYTMGFTLKAYVYITAWIVNSVKQTL